MSITTRFEVALVKRGEDLRRRHGKERHFYGGEVECAM